MLEAWGHNEGKRCRLTEQILSERLVLRLSRRNLLLSLPFFLPASVQTVVAYVRVYVHPSVSFRRHRNFFFYCQMNEESLRRRRNPRDHRPCGIHDWTPTMTTATQPSYSADFCGQVDVCLDQSFHNGEDAFCLWAISGIHFPVVKDDGQSGNRIRLHIRV